MAVSSTPASYLRHELVARVEIARVGRLRLLLGARLREERGGRVCGTHTIGEECTCLQQIAEPTSNRARRRRYDAFVPPQTFNRQRQTSRDATRLEKTNRRGRRSCSKGRSGRVIGRLDERAESLPRRSLRAEKRGDGREVTRRRSERSDASNAASIASAGMR